MSDVMWPRVSPDGRSLLLLMNDSTGASIAGVRRMDQVDANLIPGTKDLQRPYWSPDGREVGFVANGKLQRVALAGGSPIVICEAPFGSDLSWGAKGRILLDGRATDSLLVVPAGGGALEPATRIDRAHGEIGSAWPCFLPDGERFLFIGTNSSGAGGTIRLGRLGSLDSKALGHSDGRVEWAPGDWVLFVQGSLLMAQKLDARAGKLVGPPIQVTDGLRIGSSSGHFSVSPSGIFAFARGEGGVGTLQVMSRAGVLSPAVLASGVIANPAVSPDGRRLLFERVASSLLARGEMYVLDLDRGTDMRLTFTDNLAYCPQWSPDGRRFAYAVDGPAGTMIRLAPADGMGPQDSILVSVAGETLGISEWSARGVVGYGRGRTWVVPTEGTNRVPALLADSTLFVVQGRISPDGRWLAATASTAPSFNAFVFGLGEPPGRWQIGRGTTFRPRWTRGGREIVFEGADRQIRAVDVDTQDGFRAGIPHRLFTLPWASPTNNATSWDCDANGETFYVVVPANVAAKGTIEVVSDFNSLVTRR
jgi:Tol biopolymer transport system component